MSTTIHPFGLRMPPEIKREIAARARANHRSMNSEIVFHLGRVLETQVEAVAENSLQAGSATVPNSTALQGSPITHG